MYSFQTHFNKKDSAHFWEAYKLFHSRQNYDCFLDAWAPLWQTSFLTLFVRPTYPHTPIYILPFWSVTPLQHETATQDSYSVLIQICIRKWRTMWTNASKKTKVRVEVKGPRHERIEMFRTKKFQASIFVSSIQICFS